MPRSTLGPSRGDLCRRIRRGVAEGSRGRAGGPLETRRSWRRSIPATAAAAATVAATTAAAVAAAAAAGDRGAWLR